MIRVESQPEPANFDIAVRKRGLQYLRRKEIDLKKQPPSGTHLEPYWRACLDDLFTAYSGTCAYLAVRFERITGAASVDHFVAKSKDAGAAYEWSNYRLACLMMNARKRDFDDVLDPFEIQGGWFRLELVSGRIYADPALDAAGMQRVQKTIERLDLDAPGNRELRSRRFSEYCAGHCSADFLRWYAPFVFFEAKRQSLL